MADIKPPWGAFPVEQYLIYWNSAPGPSPTERYENLVAAFLALDSFLKEWDNVSSISETFHAPTNVEIENILLPWRSQHLREVAASIWTADRNFKAVWLRTYYDNFGENDQMFRKWVAEDEEGPIVLDDASAFNFGDDWERVLTILPELVGPFSTEYNAELGLCLVPSTDLVEEVEEQRSILRENLAKTPTPAEEYITYDEAAIRLQTWAVDSFIIVADEKAFETGLLKVIWLDSRANVVRQSRVYDVEVWELSLDYRERWRLAESEWFLGDEPVGETNLGEKYALHGEIGRVLYGVER